MMPTGKTLTLALGTGPEEGSTVAALRLAEEAISRGHRVAVYAYGKGAGVAADGAATGDAVRALLRRGIHGGLASWVVDGDSAARRAKPGSVEGVVTGDGGDLWRFIRDADVTLGVAR